MKVQHLFEAKKMITLSDLYIIQNNDDLDKTWIEKLAAKYKNGEEPEPVFVVMLTSKVRRDLDKIREDHIKNKTEYRGIIPKSLSSSLKKAVLIDGNHRYLAAKKAGMKSLPYESSTDAGDIVQMMAFGYL